MRSANAVVDKKALGEALGEVPLNRPRGKTGYRCENGVLREQSCTNTNSRENKVVWHTRHHPQTKQYRWQMPNACAVLSLAVKYTIFGAVCDSRLLVYAAIESQPMGAWGCCPEKQALQLQCPGAWSKRNMHSKVLA